MSVIVVVGSLGRYGLMSDPDHYSFCLTLQESDVQLGGGSSLRTWCEDRFYNENYQKALPWLQKLSITTAATHNDYTE